MTSSAVGCGCGEGALTIDGLGIVVVVVAGGGGGWYCRGGWWWLASSAVGCGCGEGVLTVDGLGVVVVVVLALLWSTATLQRRRWWVERNFQDLQIFGVL